MTVSAAMTGWSAYVAIYHPSTNTEQQVFNAWEIAKQAQLALVDATAAYAASPTNQAPLQTALTVFQASQAGLVGLISSITNNGEIPLNISTNN